jgi:hypothetical protein
MPSMMRRMRTRLPTYLSTGLGALVDIANAPQDYGAARAGLCLTCRSRQTLRGSMSWTK